MNWYEAVILGLIQGLTEFLPVSSSGHLELGKHFLGVDHEANFYFSVAVHGATVLSTLAVFHREIFALLKGLFRFRYNDETEYILKIIVSMIPVGLIGLLFSDFIKSFFSGNMIMLGAGFLVTFLFLALTALGRKADRPIGFLDALIIGIAQAVAVLPGISRSGATIATGIIIGNKKSEIARFSFLMVLVPVIGANMLELSSVNLSREGASLAVISLGFIVAFISGYLACRWMIALVRRGNLIWFALYCLIAGIFSLLTGFNVF